MSPASIPISSITLPFELRSPREEHQIFYGSFDWHGCVLAYWLLCRIYRRFPNLPAASQVRTLIDSHFTHANVGRELAYLEHPLRSTFERPYGWAWLLIPWRANRMGLDEVGPVLDRAVRAR